MDLIAANFPRWSPTPGSSEAEAVSTASSSSTGLVSLLTRAHGVESGLRMVHQLQDDHAMDNAIRMLHRDESNVEASTQKQKVRRQHNKSTPGYLSCHVCGDRAPNHIHYGGIACFSCRAFFRRSVPKHMTYLCMADSACNITPTTRKNCQSCRYHRCLDAGMKPSWVLSDQEKNERMLKKMQNRERRRQLGLRHQDGIGDPKIDAPDDVSLSSRSVESDARMNGLEKELSPPRSSFPECGISESEEKMLNEWLLAEESTRRDIPMPGPVMSEILRMTQTGAVMSGTNVIEFFRLCYSRVARFALDGAVIDFQSLQSTTKKLLMARNLDSLCTVRLAPCLGADGIGDLLKQLHRAGRSSTIVEEIQLGELALSPEQIFIEPWARGSRHTRRYCLCVRRLARQMRGDPRVAILFQLVALLQNDSETCTQLEADEVIRVTECQTRAAYLLQRYLVSRRGRVSGLVAFAGLVLELPEMSRLGEILINGEGEDEDESH